MWIRQATEKGAGDIRRPVFMPKLAYFSTKPRVLSTFLRTGPGAEIKNPREDLINGTGKAESNPE